MYDWTDTPETPGYFWWRAHDTAAPRLVAIPPSLSRMLLGRTFMDIQGQYCGPIPTPEHLMGLHHNAEIGSAFLSSLAKLTPGGAAAPPEAPTVPPLTAPRSPAHRSTHPLPAGIAPDAPPQPPKATAPIAITPKATPPKATPPIATPPIATPPKAQTRNVTTPKAPTRQAAAAPARPRVEELPYMGLDPTFDLPALANAA